MSLPADTWAPFFFHSGFKELVPNFAIRDAGPDEQRLPTASTCVNLLKVCFLRFPLFLFSLRVYRYLIIIILFQLPRYKNEQVLREKLLQAIHSGAGFDLS